MSAEDRPTRVVVVGRDAALWLAATAIRRALAPAEVTVDAVELPTRLTPARMYAAMPALEALHHKLRIDEAALLRATGGAFSFGWNLADARGATPAFFHAWGSCGAPIDGQPFFAHWVKARRFGLDVELQDFCLTAVAAKNGRMLLPDEATGAFGRTDYGYHLPAIAYAGYLKSLAPRLGVVSHQALDVAVERDGEGIAALLLDGGRRIAGELFVDATGEEALLIDGALGVARVSWRAHFPVDRMLTARGPAFSAPPPYAELRASAEGWTALHPGQATTGVVHAYASAATSDEAALRAASAVSGLPLADAVVSSVDPGRRERAWEANCVALGDAACAFDPVHGVDLHGVQLGIVHLLSLFPSSRRFAAERAEYNRRMRSYVERVRDFQSASYRFNRYAGAFWDAARATAIPDELAQKAATFGARGDVAPMEDETFLADSWQALFVGLGLEPESWPPAIDRTPLDLTKREFRRILGFIKDKVLEQPTHAAYLGDLCRSEAA